MVKIRSIKNHECTLNLGGNLDNKQDICMVLKYLPQTDYYFQEKE